MEIPAALLGGITLSVSNLEKAREISDLSESLGRKTPVHVKIDTGMGRLGVPYTQALKFVEELSQLSHLTINGIYTHFPVADTQEKTTHQQIEDFFYCVCFS